MGLPRTYGCYYSIIVLAAAHNPYVKLHNCHTCVTFLPRLIYPINYVTISGDYIILICVHPFYKNRYLFSQKNFRLYLDIFSFLL